ncbi:hypothetical protein ACET3Z_015986 [Daucus carota]
MGHQRPVASARRQDQAASGHRRKLHSSATITQREESIKKETDKKLGEDRTSDEMNNILQLATMQQIEFERAVEAGHSLKVAIVLAAKAFNATSVILDRKSKKDQKYFIDNLKCAILRVKRDQSVEYVRRPNAAESYYIAADRGQSSSHRAGDQGEVIFQTSICSICMNPRPHMGPLREFTYSDLHYSTSGFSVRSGLPHTRKVFYRGVLSDGVQIFVRKHALGTITEMEFKSRVQMLGKVRHENVAMLLGSCSDGPEKLLVYEYVCNMTLNVHLTNRSRELTWERRMKIARGIAKGLEYLHSKSFYGSMRPNNVLLTHDYDPLLANFGLARNQYEDLNQSSETRVMKTFEYLAPEYEESGIDSSKTDVYSLGVVLLELITGRKTIEETEGKSFLRWARPLLKDKSYGELIDPVVLESHDLHQLFWMVRIAEKCINRDPGKRFSIHKVVNILMYISRNRETVDLSLLESEIEPTR